MTTVSEYATQQPTGNPILDPVVYFRVTTWALGLVALLGIVSTSMTQVPADQFLSLGGTFLQFTWWHNILHIVLAAACGLFGYAAIQGNVVKTFAVVFGAVYLLLGIAGFFTLTDASTLALTPTVNVVHILLGGWALTAGLMAKY
ncbi:MAG: hypothetical protein ABR562_07890 [Thermoplasmatota archaeon]